MKVFVSGATGFIGIQLVKRLVEEGHVVHALYRSLPKAELIRHPAVTLFKGDILEILLYNRTLSDEEQNRTGRWLFEQGAKGVSAAAPAGADITPGKN